MPFYLYSAVDKAGRNLEGTIQAANPNEAMTLLVQRGFRGPRILSERASQAQTATAAAPKQLINQAQGNVQINVPVSPYPRVHHSQKSSDKDLYFLFAQVSDQLRAGIGPAQAFGELAQMYKQKKFRESLTMVSQAASEGRPISSVLEQWPDLYPEHVVGLVKAGEAGGFLPDATATISEQAISSHKFKRFHWWIWLVGLNGLISIPLVFLTRHWLLATWDNAEAGGQMGIGGVLRIFLKLLIWPWGPVMLGSIIVVWLLRNVLSTRAARKFRHQAGLRVPVLGGRARNESVTIFTWVLSRLSRGGVPPNRSWQLAVESVPNLAMQDKLTNAGSLMNEGSRISDVVFKSDLFPQEYAPVISTGELTGDISGALERLSQVSRTEFEAGTAKAKMFTGSIGCTAVIVTTGVVTIVLVWAYYHELIGKATDMDTPPSVSTSGGNTGSSDLP
jgi:type II secretory pathway component PulF